jgi:hypothetical protein
MADWMTAMAPDVELDSSMPAVRLADWAMVHRQFDSSVSACSWPSLKPSGKAHIQLPAGAVSFATSNTMSDLNRHLIKATKSVACHANYPRRNRRLPKRHRITPDRIPIFFSCGANV